MKRIDMAQTRKIKREKSKKIGTGAVAVFDTPKVKGHLVATPCHSGKGVDLIATFTKLPAGQHGFHIHKAGDLRQKNCMGLCEHYDKGKHRHGAGPASRSNRQRHTGDLGNISHTSKKKTYCLENVSVNDLWGRSIIVHKDADDLGKGNHEDSSITGHSGARMACAIFGRLCH